MDLSGLRVVTLSFGEHTPEQAAPYDSLEGTVVDRSRSSHGHGVEEGEQ